MSAKTFVLTVCLAALPTVAAADPMTVGEYEAALHNPHLNDATHAFVDGMIEGFIAMNAATAPAFCVDPDRLYNDEFAVNLLNNWIGANQPPPTDSIGADYLTALKQTFPCS